MVVFKTLPKHANEISIRVVNDKGLIVVNSRDELEQRIFVEVYEGYRKVGKFSLRDIKLKFS